MEDYTESFYIGLKKLRPIKFLNYKKSASIRTYLISFEIKIYGANDRVKGNNLINCFDNETVKTIMPKLLLNNLLYQAVKNVVINKLGN